MTEYEKIKFRDACAIAAMQSIFTELRQYPALKYSWFSDFAQVADLSYDMADAMLEEKIKRDEKLS